MFDVDDLGLETRQALRDRRAGLIAEVCAWSVGLSDRPHLRRRGGRPVPDGATLGTRAALGQPLADAEDDRLELADARPGTLVDALGALAPDGRLYADLLEEQVLGPYVLATCVQVLERLRRERPDRWDELLDDVGHDSDDGTDLEEVVHVAEWEAPLRLEAEQLVLAALADAPLVEVEAEGLPLSLVRAAEGLTRGAAPQRHDPPDLHDDDLAGALFLAEAAVAGAGLEVPVPAEQADALLAALLSEGLEVREVVEVLPHLPVRQEARERVGERVERVLREQGD